NILHVVGEHMGTHGRVVSIFRRADLGHANHYWDFLFNDTATTHIYTLSLHDALPIYHDCSCQWRLSLHDLAEYGGAVGGGCGAGVGKSTCLDSSNVEKWDADVGLKIQEYGEHRDVCRELVEQRGNVAGECDVHGGECLGMATGEFFQSGGDHGEHLLRGL